MQKERESTKSAITTVLREKEREKGKRGLYVHVAILISHRVSCLCSSLISISLS